MKNEASVFHESEMYLKNTRGLKSTDEKEDSVFHELETYPKNARGLKSFDEKRGFSVSRVRNTPQK
jgi:hypothetical protein